MSSLLCSQSSEEWSPVHDYSNDPYYNAMLSWQDDVNLASAFGVSGEEANHCQQQAHENVSQRIIKIHEDLASMVEEQQQRGLEDILEFHADYDYLSINGKEYFDQLLTPPFLEFLQKLFVHSSSFSLQKKTLKVIDRIAGERDEWTNLLVLEKDNFFQKLIHFLHVEDDEVVATTADCIMAILSKEAYAADGSLDVAKWPSAITFKQLGLVNHIYDVYVKVFNVYSELKGAPASTSLEGLSTTLLWIARRLLVVVTEVQADPASSSVIFSLYEGVLTCPHMELSMVAVKGLGEVMEDFSSIIPKICHSSIHEIMIHKLKNFDNWQNYPEYFTYALGFIYHLIEGHPQTRYPALQAFDTIYPWLDFFKFIFITKEKKYWLDQYRCIRIMTYFPETDALVEPFVRPIIDFIILKCNDFDDFHKEYFYCMSDAINLLRLFIERSRIDDDKQESKLFTNIVIMFHSGILTMSARVLKSLTSKNIDYNRLENVGDLVNVLWNTLQLLRSFFLAIPLEQSSRAKGFSDFESMCNGVTLVSQMRDYRIPIPGNQPLHVFDIQSLANQIIHMIESSPPNAIQSTMQHMVI